MRTSSKRSAAWGTAIQRLRKYWLETVWAIVSAFSVGAVFLLTRWETIPFHVVWVSLSIICCFRLWSFWVTASVLMLVTTVSGAALMYVVTAPEGPGWDELAEVPMMAAMYSVMVWGAWRREEALQEVQRSARREHEFVRDASHMLRTPITVAAGHAELIRASSPGTPVADDAATVLDELGRLATISDRLLFLHSVEDPRFLARDEVDVTELVNTTVSRWEATAAREWRLSEAAEGTIVGDEERLSQALDCLIENALKATVPGDRISIASQARGSSLFLEVSDSGSGVPKEDQDRIFERFARTNGGSQDGRGGTGLGLTIVKAIAEAHHGSVSVESEPGGGTTFRIRIEGFHRYQEELAFASNGRKDRAGVTSTNA